MTSSQPATQAPLFLLIVIIHLNFQSSRVFLEKIQYVQNNSHFDTKNQRLPGIGKSTIAKAMADQHLGYVDWAMKKIKAHQKNCK